ncbi:hypothetical protein F4777DRAFT_570789 [Nemania sp. FL0916]|nr:hypothetical protein F4777DRAFT_570789 [Nemania sp. FL0916]
MTDVNVDNLLNGPALKPPPGITANFTHPHNLNAYAHASLTIFLVLSTIAVAGRVYARWVYLKCAHLGDYLLLISYLLYVACVALVWKLTEFPGLFVHQWDFLVRDLIPYLHISFVVSNVFVVCLPTLKVAICLEWIHLFSPPGTRKFVFWTSYFVIALNVVFYFISLVLTNIACVPYEHTWNKLLPGTCTRSDTAKTGVAGAVINFVSDIIIFVIPQRTIWNLQMPVRRRLGVSIVFAMGIFACTAATARLVFSEKRGASDDFTYSFAAVAITALTEALCGLLVMCIPAIPKAYVGMKIPQLFTAIRSWPSREHLFRSKDSNTKPSSFQSSTISSKGGARGYVEVDGSAVPLSEMHAVQSNDSYQIPSDLSQVERGTGIIRTTKFEATEDYGSNIKLDYDDRRHPWKKTSP